MNKSVHDNFSLHAEGSPTLNQLFWTQRRVRQQEYNRFGTGGGFTNANSIVLDAAEGSPARIQSFWTRRRVRQQEYNRFGPSGGLAEVNSVVLNQAEE